MGTTLPQAQDVGRVGLRSSRIDLPGQGEMAIADALQRAAGTFTQMAIEHKEKDDALSYSNAKNEYLIADIKERERLKHDEDFSSHDARYREAMKGHYERLFPTVRSTRDRNLFDAEARLMNERGSVAVGDNARTKELDFEKARFMSNGEDIQAVILAAGDAQTAQDAMFGYLQQGTALRDRGILDDTEWEAVRQDFVSDVAFKRLTTMDPKEREILLERSITMTKSKGEPITPEQIQNGEGSGSIADFLTLDVRVKMLEETRRANEHDNTLTEAQTIFDIARGRFPENSGDMMDEIRTLAAQSKDPKVREEAVRMGRQYRQEKQNELSDDRDRIVTSATTVIRSGEMKFSQINPDELSMLQPHHIKALQDLQLMVDERRQFQNSTRWILTDSSDPKAENSGKSWAAWRNLSDQEKSEADLDGADWITVLERDVWSSLKAEQDRIRNSPESTSRQTNGLTNVQMVTSAIVRSGLVPQTGRDIEDSQSYQMLLYQFDRATQDAETRKGEPLTNTQRNEILAEIMVPMAFTDDYVWWPDMDDDDRVPVAAMSVSQRKTGRLDWAKDGAKTASTSSTGIPVTYQQELELMARRLGVEPDNDDYERALFALVHGKKFGWGPAEVEARLRNE